MWEKPGVLYLDFFFFLPPKAKESVTELLVNFILGEENDNDIYQLPINLLGRKEEEKAVGGIVGRCVYIYVKKYFWDYIFMIIFVTVL